MLSLKSIDKVVSFDNNKLLLTIALLSGGKVVLLKFDKG